MKKLLTLSVFTLIAFAAHAQQRAVTETGLEVLLFDDGTWTYLDGSQALETEIPTNPKAFIKSDKSSFLLKSVRTNMGIWLDPKQWSFKKSEGEDAAEYELKLKKGDLYGMLITEKIEISLESLKTAAYTNAIEAAPDVKIVHEEYRTVNGIKLLFMQMEGTLQGIKFTYLGYYFSGESGTVQLITYTAQNLVEDYRAVAEELLNGLSVIK